MIVCHFPGTKVDGLDSLFERRHSNWQRGVSALFITPMSFASIKDRRKAGAIHAFSLSSNSDDPHHIALMDYNVAHLVFMFLDK